MADVVPFTGRRYVVLMSDAVLLTDWTWITLDRLERRGPDWRPVTVWVFRSRRSADRARRTFGRGRWRSMKVQFLAR